MFGCRRWRQRMEEIAHAQNSLLHSIIRRQEIMARTLDDLITLQNKAIENAQKNTDLTGSVLNILSTDTQLLRELRDQLAAAGEDPAKLEQLGSLIDGVISMQESEANRKAAAISANTG